MTEPQDLLADIRSLELQLAQQLDEARRAAADDVASAHEQAGRLVDEATERGTRRAAERRRERLAAADTEAERIRNAGDAAATELLASVRPQLDELVDELVELVLTTSDGGG
jgi:vacuolar-type H+-ATPase subunit H